MLQVVKSIYNVTSSALLQAVLMLHAAKKYIYVI